MRPRPLWAVGLVLLSLSAGAAWAQPTQDAPRRPKIGLVLSGGGARGAAHVGVLQVLEANHVPVDLIVGTSMGAIVGGLYATGMSASELQARIAEIDWLDMFDDQIPRQDRSFRRKRDDDSYLVDSRPGLSGLHLEFPPGLLDGRKIDLMLKRYTLPVVTIRNFDALPIPFRAVAADLATGEAVVLDHGDLAMAMRASMSIPVVFTPREIDGRLLVDGGIRNNVPIDVARALGAEVVIAVDISTPLQGHDDLTSVLAVTDQLTTIMTRRNADEQIASLTAKDIFIRPDLADVSMASFERATEAIAAGVRAAEGCLDRLLPLALPVAQETPASPPSGSKSSSGPLVTTVTRPAVPQPRVIDEVRVLNHSRLADAVIKARLDVRAGDVLDIDRLERGLAQIYGLDLFESVYYDIVVELGRQVLIVDVREAAWGPNYLQFGIAIFDDYEGPNFNLGAAYIRTGLNRLNGEWRTGVQIGREPGIFTELYQPLSSGLRPFGHGVAWFGEEVLSTFDPAGKKLSEFGLRRWGIGIAAGRELGTWGEMRLGLVREEGDIEIQVGEPSPHEGGFSRGLTFAQVALDELDDLAFPRSGAAARLRVDWALEALGSDVEYEQGQIEASLARSRGRNSVFLGGMLATTRNSDAPIHSQFHLGGFTRISGYERDELQGQHASLLFADVYHRLGSSKWLQSYAGLSFEYGNVFQARSDIRLDRGISAGSAFIGLDTPIGPIYLAYGLAEGGRRNFYFFLGEPLALRRAGVQRW